jgi:hypothetical protein
MSSSTTELLDLIQSNSQRICLGKVVRITRDGKPVVTYPGCDTGGVEATLLVGATSRLQPDRSEPMLLLFLENQRQPIILGAITDRFAQDTETDTDSLKIRKPQELSRPASTLVDGKRIVISAQNEIVLKCGMSSLVLRRDVKVVIKGKRLVSRAKETNRIRGGAVHIN